MKPFNDDTLYWWCFAVKKKKLLVVFQLEHMGFFLSKMEHMGFYSLQDVTIDNRGVY
jgi:hypothetical protein